MAEENKQEKPESELSEKDLEQAAGGTQVIANQPIKAVTTVLTDTATSQGALKIASDDWECGGGGA